MKPFSALTGSAEFMLVPLTALCCCKDEPVESRAQVIAVRVQWNQKVLLIFGKSTIYRKRRRIAVSPSQRSTQKPQPAGKRDSPLCNRFGFSSLKFVIE